MLKWALAIVAVAFWLSLWFMPWWLVEIVGWAVCGGMILLAVSGVLGCAMTWRDNPAARGLPYGPRHTKEASDE